MSFFFWRGGGCWGALVKLRLWSSNRLLSLVFIKSINGMIMVFCALTCVIL